MLVHKHIIFLLIHITTILSSSSVQHLSLTAKGLEVYEEARALALDNGNPLHFRPEFLNRLDETKTDNIN